MISHISVDNGIFRTAGLCLAWFGFPLIVQADVIRVEHGGEVRGVITSKGRDGADGRVVIKTLTDGQLELEPRQVESMSQRPLIIEEYHTLNKKTVDAVPERWALAEWCREHGLTTQRRQQLERLLELDPDHEPAHRALRHVKMDGKWVTRDQSMEQMGYVKHQGRYVTHQEFDILQKNETQKQEVRAWMPKVKMWHTWINGSKFDRREKALRELKQINDPDAIPALANYLGRDPQVPVRELYIDLLSQMPDGSSVPALARLVLLDVSDAVWKEALRTIPRDHAGKAYPMLQKGLRHPQNVVVRRAGVGLGAIGDESVIEPLFHALQTKHSYQIEVPDSTPNYSFRSDGSLAGGGSVIPPEIEAMLRAGQLPHGVNIIQPGGAKRTKLITVEQVHDNVEVLEALTSLTGQNFGYDVRAWKFWYARQKQAGKSVVTATP
ncbi:MAG: HEAT repeat domain-containing protein [Planctomycetaceae bacterium]